MFPSNILLVLPRGLILPCQAGTLLGSAQIILWLFNCLTKWHGSKNILRNNAHRFYSCCIVAVSLSVLHLIQFPLDFSFDSKAGVESARRQCDKLVSLRDLLETIQNGDACVGISDISSLSTLISSMALDYCGPIRLDKELGVKTTQKVGKDTLLLVLRSVGGLVSEAESLTLEERTAQRMQHSNTLCGRLSYLCSVDIATKEVVESLSRLEAATPSSLQSLLLSSHRPQLVPLLGQRSEVFNSSISAPDHRALDRMIERYRKALAPLPCGRFGLFPALEVFHTGSTANGFIMPFGESLAVMTSEM